MKDATPRTLQQMHRRGTRYEVALVNLFTGDSVVVGFTGWTSRRGFIKLLQSRGEEIIEHMDPSEDVTFSKDAAGRWEADFGNGWVARFTGHTERTVYTMNKEGT